MSSISDAACSPAGCNPTNHSRKRRVLLRADAGRSIGFGHFVRTASLAGYLREDFRCVIASRNPDAEGVSGFQSQMAAGAGAETLMIPGCDREAYDPWFLEAIEPEDIVVLDNYYYDTEFQDEVRRRCRALVCIDDMHDRHFTADLVMSFCPLPRSAFSLEPYTRYVSGIEWSLLRREFLSQPHSLREEGSARRVMLAVGGSDPLGLTGKLTRLLLQISPGIRIDILSGARAGSSLEELTGSSLQALSGEVHLHRQASAAEIVRLMDAADLGIFPASTLCVEAFARRLPVAAGYFIDNQEEFYAAGRANGWFHPLGDLRDAPAALLPRMSAALANPLAAAAFDFTETPKKIAELFKELIKE